MNPLISIIIPVYNTEKYIDRCIASILNNTYKNLEIILVDDGSTDNSGKICDNYAKKYKNIKAFHQENQGQGKARNYALDHIHGEFVSFIDSDDFVHELFYETLLQAINVHNADIAVCNFTRDLTENDFLSLLPNIDTFDKIDKKSFFLDLYNDGWTINIAPWNKLYKKAVLQDMRFPEGVPYEDAFLIYKICYNADKIVYSDLPLYYWYVNENSTTGKMDNPQKLIYREKALREHSLFYDKITNYKAVAIASKRFYLSQLFLMYFQLKESFEQNDENIKTKKYIIKKMRRYLFSYGKYCSKENKINYLELCYPFIGSILRKIGL